MTARTEQYGLFIKVLGKTCGVKLSAMLRGPLPVSQMIALYVMTSVWTGGRHVRVRMCGSRHLISLPRSLFHDVRC